MGVNREVFISQCDTFEVESSKKVGCQHSKKGGEMESAVNEKYAANMHVTGGVSLVV